MKKNVLTLFWITLLTLAASPHVATKRIKGKPYATPSPQTFPASGQ